MTDESGIDADLVALAEAHGVATWYEDWHRARKDVSAESVIGVLGLLGVDARTPSAVASGLSAVREARRLRKLPGTVVVRQGSSRPLAEPGTIVLEDGTSLPVTSVPNDLPLGWHRLQVGTQDRAGPDLGLDAPAVRAALGRVVGHRRPR
jgi:4-alpha-glucanotransferase